MVIGSVRKQKKLLCLSSKIVKPAESLSVNIPSITSSDPFHRHDSRQIPTTLLLSSSQETVTYSAWVAAPPTGSYT